MVELQRSNLLPPEFVVATLVTMGQGRGRDQTEQVGSKWVGLRPEAAGPG